MVRESSKLKEGGKATVLGIQHVFAMFGSTILVPIATGLPVSVALFCAGIGTLIFHLVTKGKVPVFLGSSFAFIPAILVVANTEGIEFATGGIMAAGAVYLLIALAV
ncbi:MAG: uracil permease, partial [Methanocorpusculum sp.]|nr:uracil permease [Methanocorpusculum sp.]